MCKKSGATLVSATTGSAAASSALAHAAGPERMRGIGDIAAGRSGELAGTRTQTQIPFRAVPTRSRHSRINFPNSITYCLRPSEAVRSKPEIFVGLLLAFLPSRNVGLPYSGSGTRIHEGALP